MRGGRAFLAIAPVLLAVLATVGVTPCAWCPGSGTVAVAAAARPEAGIMLTTTTTTGHHTLATGNADSHHTPASAHPATHQATGCTTGTCLASCAGPVHVADTPAGVVRPHPAAATARTADGSSAGEPRPPLEHRHAPDGSLPGPVGLALACQATIRC